MYQYLQQKREYTLSKQVLRSGTSIAANIQEAVSAESRADFIHKLSVSLKEARETLFWIEQLGETGYLEGRLTQSLKADNEEICRLLYASIKTARKNGKKENERRER
jgi:four helix bundle protein